MAKKLVIVESPTKARTISRFLAGDATVMASMGHIRDLPDGAMGVDIAQGFKPTYTITAGGKKILGQLSKAAASAADVYLATDPDREGEAIAWHLQEVLAGKTKSRFHRVSFHEITRSAIEKAFAQSESVNMPRVDAQQARRILDRIVGYKVSPLLWKNVKRGTSAGRVQSVALRLVVERERAIQGFEPEEYWNMVAHFLPAAPPQRFETRLFKLDGQKPQIADAETAAALARELEGASFEVADTNTRPKQQRAAPPFITSTLQQAAGGRLRFTTRQTMQVAQQLYEGVELGAEGATGLITYMRTDSVAVAKEAQMEARDFIAETYGREYVPAKPNLYRSRQSAQGAHEAIRPSDVKRTPEKMAAFLDSRQLKLYTLIWNRFVASQMAPAKLSEHVVEVKALPASEAGAAAAPLAHDYRFRAVATKTLFPGFTRVYGTGKNEEDEAEKAEAKTLPEVEKGTACQLLDLAREQKFTEPPRRYSEASLVRELEQNGVGRPSTYASIIHTIQQREYVRKEKGALLPSELGCSVCDYLVEHMPKLFDIGFTAGMEERLDEIEEGRVGMADMLRDFYDNFSDWVVDVELIHAPKPDVCRELMAIFPTDLAWEEPRKVGKQTYDDSKFVESVKEQLGSGKILSDRQWIAMLAMAVKYAGQLPNLPATIAKMDLEKEFAIAKGAARERRAAAEKRAQRDRQPPSELALDLLNAFSKVEWMAPEKRGKRVYDDRQFFTSLKERCEADKPLTPPQEKALIKIFLKYRGQVDNFAELAAKHGIESEEAHIDEGKSEAIGRLLELFDAIETWTPPRKVRNRTYDDQDFANSVRDQFARKKNLSDRQVAAVRKMLSRYHEQLPNYAALQETHGLPPPPPTAAKNGETSAAAKQTVDEKCPKCGKHLLVRTGKRGAFLGCTGFPKCRFTKEMDAS